MNYYDYFTLAIIAIILAWVASAVNRARQTFEFVKANTEVDQPNVDYKQLYTIAKPYLVDEPIIENFDPELLKIKSARCFGSAEYFGEFYGDFMRVYQVVDGATLEDQYLIFQHLPVAIREHYSVAEIFEAVLIEWIGEVKWKRQFTELLQTRELNPCDLS